MPFVKYLLESKITWAIVLLLIFYVVFIFSGEYAHILEIKSYISQLEQEIKILEEDNKLLYEKIDLLNSDYYIEKIAREELDLVKPNEILYKSFKR